MKKLLVLSLSFCAILSPLALNAQKQKKGSKQKTENLPIELKTKSDSLTYALGVSITQGLPQYLVQSGVLVDTVAIAADYHEKIGKEENDAKKEILNKELRKKVDSIQAINNKSMAEFISGFEQGLADAKSKLAYNSGIGIANQLLGVVKNFTNDFWKGDDSKFNMSIFADAAKSSLKNEDPKIENAQAIIQEAAAEMQAEKEAEQEKELKAKYANQIAEGEKFMAENKTKEGVVTLPNGLQYKVIQQGTGEKPTASDRVKVHYKGTLLDGTVFDSSIERGEPATFGVQQVIKGWTEILQLMPVGSKWMVYIPYDLAYGTRDQGAIKPFSNLIFEIELLDIEK